MSDTEERKSDDENLKEIKIDMSPSANGGSTHEWTLHEFQMMRTTYERLSINSARLLETAKTCKKKESFLQYAVVLLGLSSSFIAALPGINDTVRAYFTSTFTLLSALIGGWMSKKAYGQKAGKFYSAYQEYKDLLTIIDNIMVSLKSDRDYESFNYLISKVESKYEIFLPIDVIDVLKIQQECFEKFRHLNDRFERQELEKIRQRYRLFIDRKSYIYLHECKLTLYRKYVFTEKFEKKSTKLFGCYEYEDWCRIHYPEKYQEFTRIYDRYIKTQTERFFTSNGDFNGPKIDLELSTRRLMTMDERDFLRKMHEKFVAYQNKIRDQEYTEKDREMRSDENYSLDYID